MHGWYADPSQLQADIWSELSLRNHLISRLNGGSADPGAELCPVPCASTAPDALNRLPLAELIKHVIMQLPH